MSKRYTVREYGVIGEPSPIGPILAELKRRGALWNALVEIDRDSDRAGPMTQGRMP